MYVQCSFGILYSDVNPSYGVTAGGEAFANSMASAVEGVVVGFCSAIAEWNILMSER